MSMRSEPFAVELTEQAEKDLQRLRPWTARASQALARLETEPHRGHALTGSLKGARSLEFSLKGSGVFRAVYVVLEAERTCVVVIVGPHENIYDRAERRVAALRRSGRL
jgi:mRNA-degrading endonuclease RelE of RelBE toxin-antitoxin system